MKAKRVMIVMLLGAITGTAGSIHPANAKSNANWAANQAAVNMYIHNQQIAAQMAAQQQAQTQNAAQVAGAQVNGNYGSPIYDYSHDPYNPTLVGWRAPESRAIYDYSRDPYNPTFIGWQAPGSRYDANAYTDNANLVHWYDKHIKHFCR